MKEIGAGGGGMQQLNYRGLQILNKLQVWRHEGTMHVIVYILSVQIFPGATAHSLTILNSLLLYLQISMISLQFW